MRWYRELLPSLPEELSGWFALLTIPPAPPFPEELWGRKACGDRLVLHRRPRPGRRGARAGHEFGSPLLVGLHAMPFPRCRARSTRSTRPGCSGTGAPTSSPRSPTRRSRCTASTAQQLPTGHSTMHLYPIDGAASRVAADATALRRTGTAAGPASSSGSTLTRPTPRRITHWTSDYWAGAAPDVGRRRLRQLPDGRGGGPGQGGLRRQLRPARRRSSAATTRENVFHVNQNIHPTGA